MSVVRNPGLVRKVRALVRDGRDQKTTVPLPQTRFHKIGTIFSRVTGLIKTGVMRVQEIPVWYPVYKAFPPKYEPELSRPSLEIQIKDIYYFEDKMRAVIKEGDILDLRDPNPNLSQQLVAEFRKLENNDDGMAEAMLQTVKSAGNRNRTLDQGKK